MFGYFPIGIIHSLFCWKHQGTLFVSDRRQQHPLAMQPSSVIPTKPHSILSDSETVQLFCAMEPKTLET